MASIVKSWIDAVGRSDRSNYLAHAIRDIELYLLTKWGLSYHILTRPFASDNGRTVYHDGGCTIWFPHGRDIDDMRSRILLAHELGHVLYNIHSLKNTSVLSNKKPSPEEELRAWEFAFRLVLEKSDYYKKVVDGKKFIIARGELKVVIGGLIEKYNKGLYENLMAAISN